MPDDASPSPLKLAKLDIEQAPICYAAERSHKLALKVLGAVSHDTGTSVEDVKLRQMELEAEYSAFKETEASKILAALMQPREKDFGTPDFLSIDFNKDDFAHMYAIFVA